MHLLTLAWVHYLYIIHDSSAILHTCMYECMNVERETRSRCDISFWCDKDVRQLQMSLRIFWSYKEKKNQTFFLATFHHYVHTNIILYIVLCMCEYFILSFKTKYICLRDDSDSRHSIPYLRQSGKCTDCELILSEIQLHQASINWSIVGHN